MLESSIFDYTMKAPLLEIELRDCLGKICLTGKEDENDKTSVKIFKQKVEQEIGGMLCIGHLHLPSANAHTPMEHRQTSRLQIA